MTTKEFVAKHFIEIPPPIVERRLIVPTSEDRYDAQVFVSEFPFNKTISLADRERLICRLAPGFAVERLSK
jgi:hypothetical protein